MSRKFRQPAQQIVTDRSCSHGCGRPAKYGSRQSSLVRCERSVNSCPAKQARTRTSLLKTNDDGLTLAKRNAAKALVTKATTVGEDGLNILQRTGKKVLAAKLAHGEDENGLTMLQRIGIQAVQTKMKDIDPETGLSQWERRNISYRKSGKKRAIPLTTGTEFLDNKYTRWYMRIICHAVTQRRKKARGGTYYDRHHIKPKSLGGSGFRDNLVLLTLREHYICHLLLTRMVTGEAYYKMLKAFIYFSDCAKIRSRGYETLSRRAREEASIRLRGDAARQKCNGAMKNFMWVNKDGEVICIRKTECAEYEAEGYSRGQLERCFVIDPADGARVRVLLSELDHYLARGFTLASKRKRRASEKRHEKRERKRAWVHLPGTAEARLVEAEDVDSYIDNGWMSGKGYYLSVDAPLKPTDPREGHTNGSGGSIWIRHPITGECLRIVPSFLDLYLAEGFVRGRRSDDTGKGPKGRKKVHNPITGEEKLVEADRIADYMDNGFVLGRKFIKRGPRKPKTPVTLPDPGEPSA